MTLTKRIPVAKSGLIRHLEVISRTVASKDERREGEKRENREDREQRREKIENREDREQRREKIENTEQSR